MAIHWKSKILLFKTETVYSTDPTPTGAANAMQATDVKLSPMEGQDLSRELDLPYLGNQGSIPADLHMKLAFKVEMQGSGAAGTAPAWGPLMRACGCAQTIVAATSVTYNPVSAAQESGTFYLYVGNTLYKMKGARGTVKFGMTAQAIPYMEYMFTGLFEVAAEATRPVSLTLTGFQKPKIAAKANTPVFTINAVAYDLSAFNFDLGNKVEPRLLITSEEILITDRAEQLEVTIEAEALGMINPYQLAVDMGTSAIVIQHGNTAGLRTAINVPLAQMQRPTELAQKQNIVDWPLKFMPLPNAGNDQFTIVLT
jgi:hypothetical protein